ncbi:adenosine deaminase [Paenibacillus xylanexedens]|uniref:adenosine deaminase n=1 Tax=Paenibacillus xylanexedens TaxID=528191 RepID=UPI003B0257AB
MNKSIDILKECPKVELHCHLDGSVSPDVLRQIAGMENIELPSDELLIKQMQAPENCSSLAYYLHCFQFVLPFLQTEAALELAAYDLIRQASEDHIVYIEVRFAPMFHTQKKLTVDQVIQAVSKGLERGKKDFLVESNMILCMMRESSYEENKNIIDYAISYRENGVVGIDLAGNEAQFPPMLFKELFSYAVENQISFTIHAGECGSAKNVFDSITLGATRIGHGVGMRNNIEVLNHAKKHNVLIEMCPTSNIQTKAVGAFSEFPFIEFVNYGIAVSINTDNRTVSGTTLTEEYHMIDKEFELTLQVLKQLNLQAITASFAYPEQKERLEEIVESFKV